MARLQEEEANGTANKKHEPEEESWSEEERRREFELLKARLTKSS